MISTRQFPLLIKTKVSVCVCVCTHACMQKGSEVMGVERARQYKQTCNIYEFDFICLFKLILWYTNLPVYLYNLIVSSYEGHSLKLCTAFVT